MTADQNECCIDKTLMRLVACRCLGHRGSIGGAWFAEAKDGGAEEPSELRLDRFFFVKRGIATSQEGLAVSKGDKHGEVLGDGELDDPGRVGLDRTHGGGDPVIARGGSTGPRGGSGGGDIRRVRLAAVDLYGPQPPVRSDPNRLGQRYGMVRTGLLERPPWRAWGICRSVHLG